MTDCRGGRFANRVKDELFTFTETELRVNTADGVEKLFRPKKQERKVKVRLVSPGSGHAM